MPDTLNLGARERVDFSQIRTAVQIPNLIEVQKRSYERFLQMHAAPADRQSDGLQGVFKSIFPIQDFRQTCSLEFVDYTIGNWECKCGELRGIENLRSECKLCGRRLIAPDARGGETQCTACGNMTPVEVPECHECREPVALQFKYDVEECQERGQTFTVPLKVTIQLIGFEKDPDTGTKSIRDIKEQEVYFGEIPMLTDRGTFIVNGTERVIVSQLHRSPGVFFQVDQAKSTYMAKVIPYRGSWVEFETDQKNILYVRIDRKRKFPATIFLRALGFSDDTEILREFFNPVQMRVVDGKYELKVSDGLLGRKLRTTVSHRGKELVKKGRHIRAEQLAALQKAKIEWVQVPAAEVAGPYCVEDVVDEETGEVLVEAARPLEAETLEQLIGQHGKTEFEVIFPDREDVGMTLIETLGKDANAWGKDGDFRCAGIL